MILANDVLEGSPLAPKTKEIFLEDKNKTLSYPADMHDDNIKFHADINEYAKSPQQSAREIVRDRPLISDEEWEYLNNQKNELIEAVPKFLFSAGQQLGEDIKAAGRYLKDPFGPQEKTPEQIQVQKDIVESGSKIANAIFETFFSRFVEPVRTFVADQITGETIYQGSESFGKNVAADLSKSFFAPSLSKRITERVPMSEEELSGTTVDLIPRSVAMAIEDVFFYGGGFRSIPKMIDNYEIAQARTMMNRAVFQIRDKVMDIKKFNEEQAWEFMKDPALQKYIQDTAIRVIKKREPSLYSGLPVPTEGGKEVAAAGKTAAEMATSPGVAAKVGMEAVETVKGIKGEPKAQSEDIVYSEDIALGNEKAKNLSKVAILDIKSGNVYSSTIGEDGIFNHSDLVEKHKIDYDNVITGFTDKKGNFVYQNIKDKEKGHPFYTATPYDVEHYTRAMKASLEKANAGRKLTEEEIFAQKYGIEESKKFVDAYKDRVHKEYKTSTDNIVSADSAKFAIPGMGLKTGAPYHETSSAFAKYWFEHLLKDPATKDKPVLMLAGISGAGKTHALRSLYGPDYTQFAAIYDTNTNSLKTFEDKLKIVREYNTTVGGDRQISVLYIQRDPIEAYVDGVLPRALKQGRIVPIEAHLNNMTSSQAVKDLIGKYPDVPVKLMENIHNDTQPIPVDKLKIPDYTFDEARKILTEKVREAEKNGTISRALKEQALTKLSRSPEPGGNGKGASSAAPSGKSDQGISEQKGSGGKGITPPPTETPATPSPSPTPPEKVKIRGFVKSVQDEMPQIKVAGQYVPRSTDSLAIKARTLIQENISLAEQMARTGTDDAAIATGAELLKHYCDIAVNSTSPAVSDALYEKAAELGNSMAERLTELGRSVQAASILSRLTPEGQLRFAAKTIQKYNQEVEKNSGLFGLKRKIPELTPDQAKDILQKTKDIAIMPDGEEKAIQFRELQNYIADLVPTPLYKKIVTIWKAGLLTGIKTSGVNIFSNLAHAFGTEVLKDLPATAVDSVVSLFTGKRAVAFTTRGAGGIKQGFEKGWRFLKTGYDERNVLGKLDYRRVSFGNGKFAKGLQLYEESIFKLLGAEDQIFYYGAKARSLWEQAKVQAINKGLKGREAKRFIEDLVDKPTDGMLLNAVSDAETAVYQNTTSLSRAGEKLKQIPGAEFVLPFSKTPSAVAMQILNYSPAGFVKTALSNIGKGKWNQRDFSKGMGRAILGLPALWLGYELFKQKKISLDRPKSESELKMWDLEGKRPNSVKIGDKWRSIQVFGPYGNLLLIGGFFSQAMDKSGSPTEAISMTMAGSAKSLTEQTFLKGMSSAMDALADPARSAEAFSSGLISSIVPTLVADVARATDTKERRAESIAQRLQSRIPWFRQYLEPQIDIMGQERTIKENFLETMADPSRPGTETKDPVVIEIRRLIDSGNKIGTTQVGDKEGYKILTQRQNTELWQRAGQVAYDKINEYMGMAAYEETPDDEKAKDIDKILDKAKIVARVEKVLELTEGMDGDQLSGKLSDLKKDGLLNRQVYDQYKRMR